MYSVVTTELTIKRLTVAKQLYITALKRMWRFISEYPCSRLFIASFTSIASAPFTYSARGSQRSARQDAQTPVCCRNSMKYEVYRA